VTGHDFESRLTRDVCTIVVNFTNIGSSDLNVLVTCVCVCVCLSVCVCAFLYLY